jgi:hypothetical protein
MVIFLSDDERRGAMMITNALGEDNWLEKRCSDIPIWSLRLQQDRSSEARWSELSCGNGNGLELCDTYSTAWLNV